LEKLVEVYTIGAKKYDDRNWEKGLKWGRVFAALMRHAWKWWGGEQTDSVDGQHHLASVAWCALALMEYERTHEELDDRPLTKNPSQPGEVHFYNNAADLEISTGRKLSELRKDYGF